MAHSFAPVSKISRQLLPVLLAVACVAPAAQAATFQVFLDLDGVTTGGCSGPVGGSGFEQRLTTTVDEGSLTVTAVTFANCVVGVYGPETAVSPIAPPWPVGPLGSGTNNSHVIETYIAASDLAIANPTTARILAAGTENPQAGPFDLVAALVLVLASAVEIPTLGGIELIVLAALLLGAGFLVLRRGGAVALVIAVLLAGATAAWALVLLDGDPSDWAGTSPVLDAAGDGSPGADIQAFFAKEDVCGPTLVPCLAFRFDSTLLLNAPPVANDDATTVAEDAAATTINVLANDSDPDSDPFSIGSVTQPANGTVVITNAGADLTYQPNANYCNTPPGTTLETFTYTLTPGGDTATVTVTVSCVADAPTAINDAATVAEDTPATTIDVQGNDTDPDNVSSITSVTQPANGLVVITNAGADLTYTPNADYCNTPPGTTLDTFTYTLSPGGSVATVTVTVTCVDDPPTAVDDAATVNEDSGANTLNVQSNDTDTDGGTNTITSVTQPANGTVVITNAGADLTYAPNANYCNNPPGTTLDTFTYTLNGGSSATVTVTVTCTDDDPTAVDDGATVAEDSAATTIDVLANDTDPDGGVTTIQSVTQPANGTVVITNAGADLTYTPNADYCNTPPGTTLDTFTYTLTPGGDTATVSVTVTCVNDNPTAVDDSATVNEDSGANPINVQANDTDPDGGTNTIQSVTQPANGTVVITNAGADLTYAPNANYCNNPPGTTLDTFTYTLSPGGSVATVTVTVTCVDDPPLAVNDAATVNEDSGANTINVQANDTDIDGGTNTIQSVTQPANGAVVITNGGLDLTYAPNANYCNDPPGTTLDTFTYTLTPGGTSATVTVTVTCLNDGPQLDLDADDDKGTGGADFALTFTEGDPATLLEDPLDATLTDIDSTNIQTLTVTLTNLLDPTFEVLDADLTGFPSISKVYDTSVPGVGTLTLTGPDLVANFQAVLRTVTYLNSDADPDATARSITFVANDGTTAGNTATATVSIVAVDVPPTAVDDSATVAEDSGANTIDVQANDTDPDGGPISITSVTQPTNGTVVITNAGADLTYQPNAEYCNSVSGPNDTFTYTLSPGGSVATVSVTVTCVDDNPTAVNDAATVTEDSGANTINVQANDTDPDGGTNSITSVTQPTNGTVVITNGGADLTYAPNANYCNTPPGTTLDTFTYTLSPGGSVATVTVTVTCVDDNPTAVADAATVTEDSGANTVNVLANDTDPDGGPISITSVTQPTNGAVVITNAGADLTYVPNPNYCNTPPGTTLDTFTYTLTPGGSSTTVTMTVTCVDDPPTAVNDAATVNEDSGANTINVQANDTDVDGGTNSIVSVTQPANGVVAITNAGADLSYTPNANYCNNPPGTTLESFTYTLTPGGSIATVTVTVTCINDPPVAGDDNWDTIGNTTLAVDPAVALSNIHVLATTGTANGVLNNDNDPIEGDPVFIFSCGADTTAPFNCATANGGNVQIEASGAFVFNPDPGDTALFDTFTYTISDGTDTDTATVTIDRFERVWYVQNNAQGGVIHLGDGTSGNPFTTLSDAAVDALANDAEDASLANDWIFVFFGAGTTANQTSGIALKNGQHLLGQHAGLSIPVALNGNPSPTVLHPGTPGQRPLLDDTVAGVPEGVAATDVIPVEIVGLNLAGNVNAIDWTTNAAFAGTGTLMILDNVVRSAGADGVDVNLAGTGATRLAFSLNNLTATGTGLDIQETGTGSLTIISFLSNVVGGATGGSGLVVNNAVFDATPGGAYQTVSGGTTLIGTAGAGNGVGGAGMALAASGDLSFTDLDIFADGGAAFSLSGANAAGVGVNVGAGTGTRVTVGTNVAIFQATGGPAVDVSNATVDLQLNAMTSTNSTSTGVSLVNVVDGTTVATFSAPLGASITNATGTDFNVNGGNAAVTYNGTITDDVGQLVNIANTTGDTKSFTGAITDGDDGDGSGVSLISNGGATIRFSGGLLLSTGANPAFAATGGGTVEVCDENPCAPGATGAAINTITTGTATALNVANTNIGANHLEFRRISSSGGGNSGIVLNATGSSGGLKVKGNGGGCTSSATCTGGAIINKTVDAVSLTNTRDVSLTRMFIDNSDNSGIRGDDLTNFTLDSSMVTNNANIADGSEANLRFFDLLGTSSITSSTISGGFEDQIRISPFDSTGTLNITSSTIAGTVAPAGNGITISTSAGGDGNNNSNFTLNVTTSFFDDLNSTAIAVNGDDDFARTVNVTNSDFEDSNTALHLLGSENADLTFNIDNNDFLRHGLNPIQIVSGSTSTNALQWVGKVNNNRIGDGTPNSGATDLHGIAMEFNGDVQAIVSVTNNQVKNTDIDGIFIQTRLDNDADAQTGRLDLTLRDNDVDTPDDNSAFPFFFAYGTRIEARNTTTICLDMAGNASAGVGGAEHFQLRQRDTASFLLERLTDGDGTPNELITNMVTVETFIVGQNDAGSTADATQANAATGFTEAANGFCQSPP